MTIEDMLNDVDRWRKVFLDHIRTNLDDDDLLGQDIERYTFISKRVAKLREYARNPRPASNEDKRLLYRRAQKAHREAVRYAEAEHAARRFT